MSGKTGNTTKQMIQVTQAADAIHTVTRIAGKIAGFACMAMMLICTVAYGGGTAGTFTANAPKTITASVTDTQGIAEGTEQYKLTVNKDAGINSVTVKVGSTTISPVTSGGNTYWINKGANPTVEATAKSGYEVTGGTGSVGAMNAAKTVNLKSIAELKFSSDAPFTLSVSNPGWDGTLESSIDDGNTWTIWNGSELSGDEDNPIYLRGTGNTIITGQSTTYVWTFTGKYCTGNIETLLDYQTVINGQHPEMGNYCYCNMFYRCSSLTTAPQLPAVTLTDYCYAAIFADCTSLTTTPELPATTLAAGCYKNMFCECASLTTAPELPATTLAHHCYMDMFNGCTSLTTAPELPATTLAEHCYKNMFSSCKSLTTPPELPVTTLTYSCYTSMFSGCQKLTTVPQLPATVLADMCYYHMFWGCTSLKLSTSKTGAYQYTYRIPTTGTGTTANNALGGMFDNTGGTFKDTPTINTTYYTDHQPVG